MVLRVSRPICLSFHAPFSAERWVAERLNDRGAAAERGGATLRQCYVASRLGQLMMTHQSILPFAVRQNILALCLYRSDNPAQARIRCLCIVQFSDCATPSDLHTYGYAESRRGGDDWVTGYSPRPCRNRPSRVRGHGSPFDRRAQVFIILP